MRQKGEGLTVEHDTVDPTELLEPGDQQGGRRLLPVSSAVEHADGTPKALLTSLSGVVLNFFQFQVKVMVVGTQHAQRLHAKRELATSDNFQQPQKSRYKIRVTVCHTRLAHTRAQCVLLLNTHSMLPEVAFACSEPLSHSPMKHVTFHNT